MQLTFNFTGWGTFKINSFRTLLFIVLLICLKTLNAQNIDENLWSTDEHTLSIFNSAVYVGSLKTTANESDVVIF